MAIFQTNISGGRIFSVQESLIKERRPVLLITDESKAFLWKKKIKLKIKKKRMSREPGMRNDSATEDSCFVLDSSLKAHSSFCASSKSK